MNEIYMGNKKIVKLDKFLKIRKELRKEGKKVVHSHGVFDLIHPGHITHLQEAKCLGDVLVVSITTAKKVNKGPGRPYFSDELRMKTLAALEVVDYVLLSEYVTSEKIIEFIQPDIYIKGKEYKKSENDVTQNIDAEIEKVRSFGGQVHFSDGAVFSSTKLLNNAFSLLSSEVKAFSNEFIKKYSFEGVKQYIDKMRDLRVLVIGDIIIDEYVFCNVQGLVSKDRAWSAKYLNEERYLGGSLAIAKHLSSFSENVTVYGIAGDEPHIHSQILNDMSRSTYIDLHFEKDFKTVVKRRYIERRGIRDDYDKIFSINFIDEDTNKNVKRAEFYAQIEKNISNYDLVVIADYGHGLLDEKAMDIIQKKAKFIALNCQTNSSNYGMNLITKYNRADIFTLDEREISLAFSSNKENQEILLRKLHNHFNKGAGFLTLGSLGAMAIDYRDDIVKRCPALTLNVKDTVGAGDAFFALASLSSALDCSLEVSLFLGNIAGALAANTIGNSKEVSKVDLLKFAVTLMKV